MDLTSEEFAAIYLTLVDMNRNTNIEEVELLTPSNDVNWVS